MFHVPEKYRMKLPRSHPNYSDSSFGNNGAFFIDVLRCNRPFQIVASDGEGWEHVSVSWPGKKQCPSWVVMCAIKDLFWDAEDLVIQYHPPESDYINCHPYTLHLWRKSGTNDFAERPPLYMV